MVSYAELYPNDDKVRDDVWLRDVARKGWIALTKDYNIRKDPDAIHSICEEGGRVFVVQFHSMFCSSHR